MPSRGRGEWTPQGNVWVGLHGAGKLMKIDYKTIKMTVYTPPTEDAGVYSVQGDPKSKLVWFSEQHVDKMARFDPKTETLHGVSPGQRGVGSEKDRDRSNQSEPHLVVRQSFGPYGLHRAVEMTSRCIKRRGLSVVVFLNLLQE